MYSPYTNAPPIHRKAGIIAISSSKCEVLLIQDKRIYNSPSRGNGWGLPKGKRDGYETPAETAKREFREETSLDIELDKSIPDFIHSYISNGIVPKDIRIHYFIHQLDCNFKCPNIDTEEIKQIKLVNINELEQYLNEHNGTNIIKFIREMTVDYIDPLT
uniref:Nudix hydrolase domain-containing protein n=1 Tax=viral metagenome TaxID=1070528 RepID=A0A6C0LNC2_9ZZZZ